MGRFQRGVRHLLMDEALSVQDAMALASQPMEELQTAADITRWIHCGDGFEVCAALKAGHWLEGDASHHIQPPREGQAAGLIRAASRLQERGAQRVALTFPELCGGHRADFEEACALAQAVHAALPDLPLCISMGVLTREQLGRLQRLGISRCHVYLSCAHRHPDNGRRLHTIRNALDLGLEVCGGGRFGRGESLRDRLEWAHALRSVGVTAVQIYWYDRRPLRPHPQSPTDKQELLRSFALLRLMMPQATLRLDMGWEQLKAHGLRALTCGINALASREGLIPSSLTLQEDLRMLQALGYQPQRLDQSQKGAAVAPPRAPPAALPRTLMLLYCQPRDMHIPLAEQLCSQWSQQGWRTARYPLQGCLPNWQELIRQGKGQDALFLEAWGLFTPWDGERGPLNAAEAAAFLGASLLLVTAAGAEDLNATYLTLESAQCRRLPVIGILVTGEPGQDQDLPYRLQAETGLPVFTMDHPSLPEAILCAWCNKGRDHD